MTDTRLPAASIEPAPIDTAKTRGAALLQAVSTDVPQIVQPVAAATAAGDMEQALARFRATERECVELRETVRKTTEQLEMTTRAHALDTTRLTDQIAFYREQNGNLQQQRDTFANYAIEVKTRMSGLTTLMMDNADHVEAAIVQTMQKIGSFVSAEIDALSTLLLTNAKTAKSLVEEANEAAKNDTIVRLQNDRQTA